MKNTTKEEAQKRGEILANKLGPYWMSHVHYQSDGNWGWVARNQKLGVFETDRGTYYAIIYRDTDYLVPGLIVARPPVEAGSPQEAIWVAVHFAREALAGLRRVVDEAENLAENIPAGPGRVEKTEID